MKRLIKAGFILSAIVTLALFPSLAGAQDVILPSRTITARAAIDEIQRQTEYTFVANLENIDASKVLMLPASSLSVKEILDEVLKGSGSRWEMVGNSIVIVMGDVVKTTPTTPVENYLPRSAMNHTEAFPEMKVVRDPWAKKQISPEEINRIKNGYWARNSQAGEDSIGLAMLHFRLGSSRLERNYMDNARTLDLIHRTFTDKEILASMDFITVTAAASPEGGSAFNERLAAQRAMAIKSYFMWKYPFMNRDIIFTFSIGEDWTGLRKCVSEDYNTPYYYDVLDILDSDFSSNVKRAMLKSLGGGVAYRYLAIHHLPKLRGGAACMIYFKQETQPTIIKEVQVDTVYVERVIERTVEVPVGIIGDDPGDLKVRKPYWWAVKTNLLYDAVLVPDLAVEFTIGRKVSLELNGQWSWWNTPGKQHYMAWRFQSIGLEARYWLGDRDKRTPLSGHALGVYGLYGNYDIRLGKNRTGILSRNSFSAGFSYAYGLPIARSWNVEFGVSVGYVGGKYETYRSYDPARKLHLRDGIYDRHYVGPTKLRISISWLPSGKNTQVDKLEKKNKNNR